MREAWRQARLQCRWTRESAALVLAAWERSGESLAGFAARHGLQVQRLRRWRRRLREAAEDVEFAPVLVGATPRASGFLEVAVGRGVVRVPSEFDACHLRRVLGVLASC